MNLTHDEVLEILKVLDTADLDYFELRTGETVIIASRAGAVPTVSVGTAPDLDPTATSEPPAAELPPTPEPIAQRPVPGAAAQVAAAPIEGLVDVTAPIVGIFYRTPEPGAPPFAEVGDEVSAGATLGLIEVMKMFNSVTAPTSGTVVAVTATSGDFVEFGQPLLQIAPSAST